MKASLDSAWLAALAAAARPAEPPPGYYTYAMLRKRNHPLAMQLHVKHFRARMQALVDSGKASVVVWGPKNAKAWGPPKKG